MVNYSLYYEGKTILRDDIARTMCGVFPSVYFLDFPQQKVSLLFGFKEKTGKGQISSMVDSAISRNENEAVKIVMGHFKNIEAFDCGKGQAITDDKNPIDSITLEQIT
jgi:hypothetical protein